MPIGDLTEVSPSKISRPCLPYRAEVLSVKADELDGVFVTLSGYSENKTTTNWLGPCMSEKSSLHLCQPEAACPCFVCLKRKDM